MAICHDLAWGRYDRAEELFNLTKNKNYPDRIASLAESFGMMLVKVEAREFRMEQMIEELKQNSEALEIARRQLIKENRGLERGLLERFSSKRIVGQTPGMRRILDQIERLADTSVNVLIYGETGTGKELVAKALHYNSLRKAGPFVAVNCSAVPETLFESELFGIEKGVATGVNMRRGLLEQANGGTLLLDEIGDLPSSCQGKLLRVLEERTLTRVGGYGAIPVDIRVVAATNKDLVAESKAGRFCQDLYFRLNVVCLNLPPLRERLDDIPLLLKRFLEHHCRGMNRPMPRLAGETMAALMHYAWPGNVRELENEVERLVALTYATTIHPEDLSPHIRCAQDFDSMPLALHPVSQTAAGTCTPPTITAASVETPECSNLANSERHLVQRALKASRGNKTQTAKLLGISREGLRKKLKRMSALDTQ